MEVMMMMLTKGEGDHENKHECSGDNADGDHNNDDDTLMMAGR